MSRFEYVKFDARATRQQENIKNQVLELEALIEDLKGSSVHVLRAKALALTKLEEVYMWTGKAIRDAQTERTNRTKKKK